MKKKFVRCTTQVNPNAVKRISIEGAEHIVVTSFTMPDDIIMNRVLYPASETARSFEGLNRTFAPIGHPTDTQGNFISAADPQAIHNFHAGAFNDNARKVGSRIQIDKTINVQEAMKSDRGKRLLDRIKDLEANDKAKPIHTSTGIFLELEMFEQPQTNTTGQEFDAIARNLVFDHDAILLDEIGAATPDEGVGMAVNKDGDEIESEIINLDLVPLPFLGGLPGVDDVPPAGRGPSIFTLMDQLREAANEAITSEWLTISDMFNDSVVFETDQGFFEAKFIVDANEKARLTGIPNRVDRVVSYKPKVNSKDNTMKDLILSALKAADVETEGLSDADAVEAYNKLLLANAESERAEAEEKAAAEAAEAAASATNTIDQVVKPLVEQLESIQNQLKASSDADKETHVKAIINSNQYPSMTEEDLNALPVDRVKELAANMGAGFGIAPVSEQQKNEFSATQMPE